MAGKHRAAAGCGEHKSDVRISTRAKRRAEDAAFRRGESVPDFLVRAIYEQWWRDRRREHHERCEAARLRAQERGPAGSS